MTAVIVAVVMAIAWFAAAAATIAAGRPQPLADAPEGRLDCLSYAPFRKPGETPFEPAAYVSRERIAEDLRLLSARTSCVRTYSVDQGLDAVPEVAASLGMQVLLGAWLSRDRVLNRVELERAIALAREHGDTVRALIVGNEVLLRRELPERELKEALDHARSQAGVPVTYADVWEFWLEHPRLVDAVDFVTIHILPYWEDEPVGIDQAVEHVRAIYRRAEAALGGAPGGRHTMLIGETGWPSAGRSREEARPGVVEQARFLREFVAMAQAEKIPYNLIEAFDQPWKARLEGAMGAHWGVFDSAGEPKFPWQGPVVARPGWRAELGWSVVGALAFAGLGFAFGRRGSLPAQAFAGGATTLLLLAQWRYLQDWNRDAIEWAATLPFLLASAPLAWLAVDSTLADSANALRESSSDAEPPRDAVRAIAEPIAAVRGRRTLDTLRMLFLFGAAVNIVLLVFDARYRGFPLSFFAVPAAVELLRLGCSRLRSSVVSAEARLLAAIVAGGSLAVAVFEGAANSEAMAYCGLMLVYALARIDFRLLRSNARAASTVPTADGS